MRKSWLKKASVDELISAYTEEVLAQDKAMDVNDYKTGNKHADISNRIYNELRSRGREAHLALLPLLEHKNARVRSYSAVALLEVAPEPGERVLEEIALHEKSIIGLGAEYALKEYRNRAGRFSHIPKVPLNPIQ
jgi:PP-loop superfamily ATP-utilizing enzyme